VEAVRKLRSEIIEDVRGIVKSGEKQNRVADTAPIKVVELNTVYRDKAAC
jgi:hypothetical protein